MPAQPFAEVRERVDRVVRKVFPKAKPTTEFGLKGWSIARPKGAPRPEREGTMPSDRIMVFLADRKAGPTLHVWYPSGEHRGLRTREAELSAAGFKVMVGCLVFAKKQPYPVDAVEALLRDLKTRDSSPSAAPRSAAGPARGAAGRRPSRAPREGRARACRAR